MHEMITCVAVRLHLSVFKVQGTYAEADFDVGPDNDRLAVRVGFEVFDGEDADYLDDCDEESEGKDSD